MNRVPMDMQFIHTCVMCIMKKSMRLWKLYPIFNILHNNEGKISLSDYNIIFLFFFQQFNNYYISEHKNLLDLWRDIGSIKRTFSEVKHLTTRDLTDLRGDLDRYSHLLSSACQSAQANMSYIPTGDKASCEFYLLWMKIGYRYWVSFILYDVHNCFLITK